MSMHPKHMDRAAFFRLATWFEGSLLIAAYLIGWAADLDPWQDLRADLAGACYGLLGTLPLYLMFVAAYRAPAEELRRIHRILVERMGPLLNACRMRELVYLAVLAGVTEETLFRGMLQPLLELHGGWVVGLIGSNMLFALAHAITKLYALIAGVTGIYLGLALDIGDQRNLSTPIIIHALYDFLAFLAVARSYRESQSRSF